MTDTYILASQSPRRKQLLEMAEINFEIIVEDTNETYPPTLSINEIPIFIATEKARVIANKYPNRTVIAADTVVVLNNEIIGKPKDRNHAIEILKKLSGNTHHVITGVVIMKNDDIQSFSDITAVTFYPLSQPQIEYYIDRYKPYDKAGAYAIQEWIGAIGIANIKGCFYNVMGLPISKLIQKL